MGLAKARIVIVNENEAKANNVEKDKNAATAATATTAKTASKAKEAAKMATAVTVVAGAATAALALTGVTTAIGTTAIRTASKTATTALRMSGATAKDKEKDTDKKIEDEKERDKYIEVMFNPSSLKIKSATKYADTKAFNVNFGADELKQFTQMETEVLTVDLFFDTTRNGAKAEPVRDQIIPLLKLARVPEGSTTKMPPKLKFAWGDLVFHCVIASIEQTYDYFNSSGQALRATLNITFLGYDENWKKPVELPAELIPPPNTTDLKGNSSQSMLTERPPDEATRLTGEPTNWKPICDSKGIVNPLNPSEFAGV